MASRTASVFTFGMQSPTHLSGLQHAIDADVIDPRAVVCVYVKTEGNGQDNDYSRDLASLALSQLFARYDAAPVLIASGGCEGVLSPHCIVVQRRPSAAAGPEEKALAIGRARTRRLAPEEIGTPAQSLATAEAVRLALADAGMAPDEVAVVQVKAAILTDAAIAAARAHGAALACPRPHASKPLTRSASALGVAFALGEIASVEAAAGDEAAAPYTSRALVTPGNVDFHSDVIAYGHAAGWSGPHRVGAASLRDLIDARSAVDLLRTLDLNACPQLSEADTARLDAVLFKGDPPAEETIRGRRHVIWRDSDIQPPRHVRAAVGGMLAGLLGTTRIFCAGGAEHQGPPGGGVLAVFARRNPDA